MPIHHNSLEEKRSQYEGFLREYEPKITGFIENTQRIKKQYEVLQKQLAAPLLKNSNLGLLKKQHAFEQAVAALDNTEDLLSYFLELLKNPKISPALPSNSSQLDDVQKQIEDKIKRLPHPEINELLLRCILSYKPGNNLKNLDNIRFWTGNDLGREGLMDCIIYQWKIDYEKTFNKLSKINSAIEHVAHRQNDVRFAVKELLQQLKKLQYINQKRKGISEEQIKQALVNMIPSLRNLDNTKPLTEALEDHLNNLIDSSLNIDDLDTLSQQIKKTNELFRFTVSNQAKRHFTKHLKKFTTKERKVNDLLSPSNSAVSFATEIDQRDEVVDALKHALKSNSQRSTKKSNKPAVLTLSSKLIGSIYSTFNRGFSELFYGFLPDSLSLDDVNFKLLDNPYFSYDDFVKFFDENTEALNTASKQLDALSVSVVNKLDDAANERLGNNDPDRDIPADDVHSILGFRETEETHDAFAKILTRTARRYELDKKKNQVAQKQHEQPIANPSHSNTNKTSGPNTNRIIKLPVQPAAELSAPNSNTLSLSAKSVTEPAATNLNKQSLPVKSVSGPAAPTSTTHSLAATYVADLSTPKSSMRSLPAKPATEPAAPKSNKHPLPMKSVSEPAAPSLSQSLTITLEADLSAPKSSKRSLPAKLPTGSEAPSLKTRSLPNIPVKIDTTNPFITKNHAAQLLGNTEDTLAPVTVVEEHPLSEKPSSSSTPLSSPQNLLNEASQLSRIARTAPLQTKTEQTNTLNIVLTNKVLIPHVMAVRKYQSVLKRLSADIQTQLALFEMAETLNPDTQYMLKNLKNKLDARVRVIDANPITDYRNNRRYSYALNIITNDQASFGNTLNIHKTIIATKEACTPATPEPTLSWFGLIANTLSSLSNSVRRAVKKVYIKLFNSTTNLAETHDTQVTAFNTTSPYAFINSIQEQFEAASIEALEQIDQYDNHMKYEQEQRLEYAKSSGIFNSLFNSENKLLNTSTENTAKEKKAAPPSDVSPATNPHGFYAKPDHEKKREDKRHAKKAHSKTLPSNSINNEHNHSFTVCF